MEYIYTPAPLPTHARWRTLNPKYPGESVLRSLQYERLETAHKHGQVLHVGGGSKARSNAIWSSEVQLDSVNIKPEMEPTYIVEPHPSFPIDDESYDTVVRMNTLDQAYDAKFVIREVYRVLKPGGNAYISVPFMFGIHSNPDAIFRATPSWWKETLRQIGFARTEL